MGSISSGSSVAFYPKISNTLAEILDLPPVG